MTVSGTLYYWLGELSGLDSDLDEELANVVRIRNSPWIEQDLPAALDHLLELVKEFQQAANAVAEAAEQAVPDDDDEEDES